MPHRPIPPDPPPDFLTTSRLVHRLYLDPLLCLTPPRPWTPLTDAEWAALAPCLAALGCGLAESPRPGRPMVDPRARLDAIFRAVTLKHRGGRAPWRLLPEAHGKADTISRTHRRWGAAGLWRRLLVVVGSPRRSKVLAGLTHWICCAFRRGIRQTGLAGLVLARRLKLFSALPGPSHMLADPDLSETVMPLVDAAFARIMAPGLRPGAPPWQPPPGWLRLLGRLVGWCAGRPRVPRLLEPA